MGAEQKIKRMHQRNGVLSVEDWCTQTICGFSWDLSMGSLDKFKLWLDSSVVVEWSQWKRNVRAFQRDRAVIVSVA